MIGYLYGFLDAALPWLAAGMAVAVTVVSSRAGKEGKREK